MFFSNKKYESININEINNIDKPNIIDVRTKEEYQSGALKNAKNIDMNALIINPSNYLKKDEKYYVYCASGMRSASVCKALEKDGYDVVNLSGGIMQYKG